MTLVVVIVGFPNVTTDSGLLKLLNIRQLKHRIEELKCFVNVGIGTMYLRMIMYVLHTSSLHSF